MSGYNSINTPSNLSILIIKYHSPSWCIITYLHILLLLPALLPGQPYDKRTEKKHNMAC